MASRTDWSSTIRTLATFIALSVLALSGTALAQVPLDVSYQGQLLTAEGALLAGPVNIQLRVYENAAVTGGEQALYVEDHLNVAVEGGVFDLLIGQGTPVAGTFGPATFAGSERYLELYVNGERLDPRQAIGSVPYAYQAESAVFANASGSASVATLADDSTRLGGLTLSEVTEQIPTAWVNGTGQVTTAEQVVIGAATPMPTTSLHVAGDTVIQGGLIAGDSGIDLLAEITALRSQVSELERTRASSYHYFDGNGADLGEIIGPYLSGEGSFSGRPLLYNEALDVRYVLTLPTGGPRTDLLFSTEVEYLYYETPNCSGQAYVRSINVDVRGKIFHSGPCENSADLKTCPLYISDRDPDSLQVRTLFSFSSGTGSCGETMLPDRVTRPVLPYDTSLLSFPYPLQGPLSIDLLPPASVDPASRGANALLFDGIDDRANRADLPAELLGGAAKFVGAWVRPEVSSEWQNVFYMGADTSGGGPPGGQTFSMGVTEAGNVWIDVSQWNFSSSHTAPPGQWTYIFAFWDPALAQYGIGKIEDGLIANTYVVPGNASSQQLSGGPIYLGSSLDRWHFNGELSGVALLDHVPTDAEIRTLAAGVSAPASVTGLVAYWSLDQASGTTAIDQTGNGWDLNLENGPGFQPASP